MTTHRVHNFGAGPSTLPLPVLEEVRDELVDYRGSGMSLLEMSHRGDHYDAVHTEAMRLAREVFALPDDFDVLFLQGGATLQFSMVPANLLTDGASAAIVRTGSWSRKALADARAYGDTYVAWDGANGQFTRTPTDDELQLRPDTRYLHVCSNETIEGLRFPEFPDAGVPLVADMSSDIATRELPWERFDVVYGGAQKNLGPAGMAVVFLRRATLGTMRQDQGAYLRYGIHADKDSLYNTPPVFSIWVTGKVLRWIRDSGGLKAMTAAAERRAGTVYEAIDSSDGFYRCPVEPHSRSLTNVVFQLPDTEAEAAFLDAAREQQFVGLRGHRSVGGCRASLYNAMPQDGADALATFMDDFRRRAS
ncbi:MAG: 3-phosphoserine/phosphohydroxythreonine transaminase [Actinobacteria bacterium]|nr:3-phosphoserine/phosphohydroxythreonine transaminase [Actinomycetota bacterium]